MTEDDEDDRQDYKPVIVIATTSNIRLIDRYGPPYSSLC